MGSTVYVDEESGELVDDQTGESGGVPVLLETEQLVVEYFGSFEAFTGYEEAYLSEAYAAISTLYGYRDGESLTEPALDALNYMLGLNPPDPADPLPPADE